MHNLVQKAVQIVLLISILHLYVHRFTHFIVYIQAPMEYFSTNWSLLLQRETKLKNRVRILWILHHQLCMCLLHGKKAICHQLCMVGSEKSFRMKILLSGSPETVSLITPLITITEIAPKSHHRDSEYCCLSEERNTVRKKTYILYIWG
jgi:hypothetical protein